MTRGNQREKAREKAQKLAGSVKGKNTLSGSEQAKAKEDTARIMREKQAAAAAKKEAEKAAGSAGGGGGTASGKTKK